MDNRNSTKNRNFPGTKLDAVNNKKGVQFTRKGERIASRTSGRIIIILEHTGKTEELIEYVKDRPGHDRRYAINSTKIKSELGWEAEHSFERAIQDTIKWYLEYEKWRKEIISGEYQNYYKLQYSSRSL